jgi:hypothetical protein
MFSVFVRNSLLSSSCVVFSPRRGEKTTHKQEKYHAAAGSKALLLTPERNMPQARPLALVAGC